MVTVMTAPLVAYLTTLKSPFIHFKRSHLEMERSTWYLNGAVEFRWESSHSHTGTQNGSIQSLSSHKVPFSNMGRRHTTVWDEGALSVTTCLSVCFSLCSVRFENSYDVYIKLCTHKNRQSARQKARKTYSRRILFYIQVRERVLCAIFLTGSKAYPYTNNFSSQQKYKE